MIQRETLGNLVSFKTGKLNSNAAVENGKYPFFTCSQETYKTDTFSFDTTCVLLAGNNANGIYPLKYFTGKFDAYQRTYVIEPLDRSRLDTRYLYFALTLQLERLRSISTGAATKFLTLTILRDIGIEFPEFKIQHRIASILSAYDDLIENNTSRIAILEEMARRIYEEWFVKFKFPGHEKVKMIDSELGKIPEGWKVVSVSDAVKRFPSGKKYDQKSAFSTGVVPILDQGKSGIIGYHNEEPSFVASKDDPVIVFANHTCYQRIIYFPFSAIQNVIPYKSAPVYHRDIYWLYHATFGLVKLNDYKGHWPQFAAKKIPIPPSDICSNFGNYVNPLHLAIYMLDLKNTNLRTTRDFLLPKLISGEIDVSQLPEPEEAAA